MLRMNSLESRVCDSISSMCCSHCASPSPRARGLLVLPVRGDAELGGAVHRLRADLHLDVLALGPHHRRVQRLVEVELGHRDVVLEAPRDGTPDRVQRAQRRVAVLDRLDEHADPDEVEDVVELPVAVDHLLVDGPVVLRAAGDLGADLDVAQALGDLGLDAVQVAVALRLALHDHRADLVVDLGLQRRERQVLQLPLELLHAQAVRQRRVDPEGLGGLLLLLGAREVVDRAHVVQAVGELDEQDPQVVGHRQQHLAQALGLLLLLGGDRDAVQLGDPVDQRGGDVAELRGDVVAGEDGVLDHVVEQRRDQRRGVRAEVGEDLGDADGVDDVGLARTCAAAPRGPPRPARRPSARP